jgi:hypothetical protein
MAPLIARFFYLMPIDGPARSNSVIRELGIRVGKLGGIDDRLLADRHNPYTNLGYSASLFRSVSNAGSKKETRTAIRLR